MEKKNMKINHLTLSAVLCALSLCLFVVEAQIPLPIPIPGIKLGISNIVTLFALLYLPYKDVLLILLGRIILGSIFSSNPSVILYSLSGGILSLFAEIVLLKLLNKKFIVEISVIGAMAHNLGQIICGFFVTGTASVFVYLPLLLIAGAVSGTFCGLATFGVDKTLSSVIIKLLK